MGSKESWSGPTGLAQCGVTQWVITCCLMFMSEAEEMEEN